MNERIRELAKQAGYTKDIFGVGHWDMPECQKFAQLIVKECMDIARNVGNSTDSCYEIEQTIQNRFGVEE